MYMIELDGFVANDPNVWFRALRYLHTLYYPLPIPMLQAQFPERFPVEMLTEQYGDSAFLTRTLAVTTINETVILSRGMTDWTQVPNVILGWRRDRVNNTSWGCNESFYNGARQLLNGLPQTYLAPEKQITWIGYSYGGAVAQLAAALMWNELRQPVNCISFGAPRVGNRTFAQAQAGTRLTKIMNHDDGVASVPPHYDESSIFWALWTRQFAPEGISQQVQSYPVYVVNDKGNGSWQASDYRGPDQAQADVAQWLRSQAGFGATSHAIEVYLARLAALTSEGGPVYSPPPQRTHGPAPNPSPSVSTQVSRAGDLAIQFAGRDPTSDMSQKAAAEVQLTNSKIYRARRDSKKTFGVKLGTEWITRGLKKRQAKRRARQLNLAKRVQQQLA